MDEQETLHYTQLFAVLLDPQDNILETKFLDEVLRDVGESHPTLTNELQQTMKNLVSDAGGYAPSQNTTTINDPGSTTNVFRGGNQSSMIGGGFNQALMHQTINDRTLNSQTLGDMNPFQQQQQLPYHEEEIKSQTSSKLAFSKREFQSQINPNVSMNQSRLNVTQDQASNAVRRDQAHMEITLKQQILKETCELPFVQLSEEDEKLLFDLSVQLKFGDFKQIINASQKLTNLTFFDFPIEVFLQRTDILRALLDLLEGTNGNSVYTNLSQPALLVFLQRLKSLYTYLSDTTNKISHVNLNQRDQSIPLDSYINMTCPCNHNGRWQGDQDQRRYGVNQPGQMNVSQSTGYSIKQHNMTAATLQNSLSVRAAVGMILTKSIYLLKDSEKIGHYVQLIKECQDTLITMFRFTGNMEFCDLLHLTLFAFDSVCDFYKDAIFDEVLISPILKLIIEFIDYLNQLSSVEGAKKQPFSECFYLNTENLQRTLRRALFKNYFQDQEQNQLNGNQIILTFFERLEHELVNVNLLQRNVTSAFSKAKDCYERYLRVQAYKLNTKGLLTNEETIVFVENMNQYYQALTLLDDLLYCVELRLDFPFEHLMTDCIIYSIILEDQNLNSQLDKLETLFKAYLSLPVPEVRERILRKLFQRVRLGSATGNRLTASNNSLIARFLFRKQILNQFVNGLLINNDIAQEESKLQVSIGSLIIKLLITGYNELAQNTSLARNNLNQHLLTFHCLLREYSELIGLIDLIEENSPTSKSIRYHRLLRDLFSIDSQKREFATSVLRNNLSKDFQDLNIKDLVRDTFDFKQPSADLQLELEQINQNMDYSSFDMTSITGILMGATSDYSMKKMALDQLAVIVFDVTNKRGRNLLKVQGQVRDVFSFLIDEILSAYNTCQTVLRGQVSNFQQGQLLFVNESLRIIFMLYVLYFDEPEVKQFFDKFRLLQTSQKGQQESQHETFLQATLFFIGNQTMRKNALRLLHVLIFNQVLLSSKISKKQQPNGQIRKSVQILVPEFFSQAFVMLLPSLPQPVKQPLRDDLILTGEQKLYVQSQVDFIDTGRQQSDTLSKIALDFCQKVVDKNEDYNKVMRSLETLENHILSTQQLSDELVNKRVLESLVDIFKTLPTRDFEFNFLADYFLIISQILQSHKEYSLNTKHIHNLEQFISHLCEALRYHVLPFLAEAGFNLLHELNQTGSLDHQNIYSPKLHFVQRFLELLSTLMTADTFLKIKFRVNSNVQDKLLKASSQSLLIQQNDSVLIRYLIELYEGFKSGPNIQSTGAENRRRIQTIIARLVNSYDLRNEANVKEIPRVLITQVAIHRLNQSFQEHSLLMLSMRSLMVIQEKRIAQIKGCQVEDEETNTSMGLSTTTKQHMSRYSNSLGWLIRFIESRDSRIRILAWDLLSDYFDYELIKTHPSLVNSALKCFLQHQELFSVKISALKFLNLVCDGLIRNCELTREELLNENLVEGDNFIGSSNEQISINTLLQQVFKQGLITQIHFILGQRDSPLLFLTLSMKFLHKLMLMDYKRALPVLTQLDYWTFLVDLLSIKGLKEQEQQENRMIIKELKATQIRYVEPTQTLDIVYLALNAVIEFLFEACKKDAQIANLLVKTTKLMPIILELVRNTIDQILAQTLPLANKSILAIFIDKIVKLIHVALLHPKEYTMELLSKFIFDQTKYNPEGQQAEARRNWWYILNLFTMINQVSQKCYFYGQVEVKLGICRMIAEFLLRLPKGRQTYLDEMIGAYEAEKHFTEDQDTETYGSQLLLEFGMVFKELYVDKTQARIQQENRYESEVEQLSEQENMKADISICLSILLSASQAAKRAAVEHNMIKKVLDICSENHNSLNLAELQRLTSKTVQKQTAPSQKSIIGKSTINNSMMVQSVFESQMKRTLKYADANDTGLCEREILRMLSILKHLFYNSGQLLIPMLFTKPEKSTLQSKQSTLNQSKLTKQKEAILGERIIQLFGSILEDLDNQGPYEEVVIECLMTATNFASQNVKFKNAFIAPGAAKKQQLLKTLHDKVLSENLQGNSFKMKMYFTLLRSLSMSAEIAKEIMKMKTIEDIHEQISPVCKSEKDIKLMRYYLQAFFSFLPAYASTDEGQKIILKNNKIFEQILWVIDHITLTPAQQNTSMSVAAQSQQPSEGTKALTEIVVKNLLFLRNSAFNRTTKLHFLSNQSFLPCLLSFLTNQQLKPRAKAYSAACLWVILFNHQGVKSALNQPEVISELQLTRQEFQRQCDIDSYSHYVASDQERTTGGDDIAMRKFTLQALNGILTLFQQK